MNATGHAFGKVILLGEHAVVLGHPALAAALDRGVVARAEATTSGGIVLEGVVPGAEPVRIDAPRVLEAANLIASRVGVTHARVQLETALPAGGGLGSSGAFAVALLRALAGLNGSVPDVDETCAIALESERIFHGSPSGVDPAVSARGGILLFRRGDPPGIETVVAAKAVPVVVGLSGVLRETRNGVTSLLARREADPGSYDPLLNRLGELSVGGAGDVRRGDFEALGARMNEAHTLLSRCQLSSPELDLIVGAATKAGALGAKLTGAGQGGAAIALAPNPEPVLEAIRAAGFDAFFVELS